MKKWILLFLLLPNLAWGATLYVRPLSGEYGAEDGTTYATAFDGFDDIAWGESAGQVGSGDTLYVCGTHTEQLTLGSGGTAGNILTVRGDYGGDPGVINSGAAKGLQGWQRDYVTITQLEVTGATEEGIVNYGGSYFTVSYCTVHDNDDGGIRYWGNNGTTDTVDYGVIDHCTVYNNGDTGIYAGNYGIGGTISNNTVYSNCTDVSFDSNAGIKIWAGPFGSEVATNVSGWTVENNHVYSNGDGTGTRGCGIWSDTSNSNIIRYNSVHDNWIIGIIIEKSSSCQVYYNIVYNHTDDNSSWSGRGISLDRGDATSQNVSSNDIWNNVIYNSREALIVWSDENGTGNADNNEFRNNIILTASDYQIFFVLNGNGSGNVFSNNCLGAEAISVWWEGALKTTYDAWETSYGGTTASVESDPALVSASNFHILAASPAKNAGTSVGLTRDKDGIPIVGLPDIGAYEYFGTHGTGVTLIGGSGQ